MNTLVATEHCQKTKRQLEVHFAGDKSPNSFPVCGCGARGPSPDGSARGMTGALTTSDG